MDASTMIDNDKKNSKHFSRKTVFNLKELPVSYKTIIDNIKGVPTCTKLNMMGDEC